MYLDGVLKSMPRDKKRLGFNFDAVHNHVCLGNNLEYLNDLKVPNTNCSFNNMHFVLEIPYL